MIDTGPQPLAPTSNVTRAGVNAGNGPVLPSLPLIKGQLVEGVVTQVHPRLLVETASSVFSAAVSSAAYTLGERLLFRVLDPSVNPPRLELLRSGQVADTSIAQQSAFLRSLLYRPNSLAPLQQWLSNPQTWAQMPPAIAALLQELWPLTTHPKATDIQRSLLMSGLFSESRDRGKGLAEALLGPAKPHNDLKALLKLLAIEEGFETQIKPLLEALQSSQIKGLDATVNGQLHYQWMVPWFEQQHFMATLQQNQQQRTQGQWSLSLVHEGPDLGALQINLLLTQVAKEQNATASLHFSSDEAWLIALILDSKQQLQAGLHQQGIVMQQLSTGPYNVNAGPHNAEGSNAIASHKQTAPLQHSILDLHV